MLQTGKTHHSFERYVYPTLLAVALFNKSTERILGQFIEKLAGINKSALRIDTE